MKVILTQDVKKIGKKGEIKDVADGYAKNFLIPKKMAVAANKGNIVKAEVMAEKKQQEAENFKKEAQKSIENVKTKKILIKAKAKNGKLFGSIGAKEIVAALKEHHLKVSQKDIKISKPIKETGYHEVELDFGNGLAGKFKLEVVEA